MPGALASRRIGFHSIHHSPLFGATTPLFDIVRAAASAGFGDFGVDLASLDAYLSTGGTLAALRDEIERFGMSASDVLPIVGGADLDTTMACTERVCAAAVALGAGNVLLAVSEPAPFEQWVRVVGAAGAYAARNGLRLSIEFTGYTPLASLDATYRLCDEAGWEVCSIALDSLHLMRTGGDVAAVRSLRSDQIGLVQLSDAQTSVEIDLVDDSRNRRLPPGDGELPLQEIVDAIDSTGYTGPIIAEVLSSAVRAQDPVHSAAAIHTAMRRLC